MKLSRAVMSNAKKVWSSSVEAYDSTQVSFLGEQCIAVDENDNVISRVSKGDAHAADTMVLHRAFSVFAFTPNKKLILQRRSDKKITFPGLWANTCCSHPLYNDYELNGVKGVKRAAIRKLEHELGVVGLREEDFVMGGRFLYYAMMKDAPWGEHELDYGLVLPGLDASRIRVNENEVSDVCEVSHERLVQWIQKDPDSFTPWVRLFFNNEKLLLWWRSLGDLQPLGDNKIYSL